MSNRKAEVLNKYLYNLSQLGYTRDDEKVKAIIKEIETEMGLLTNDPSDTVVKDSSKALVIAIKDCSGSMGFWENNVGKEYYELALRSLKEKYVDIKEIFINHSTIANESEKEKFFVKYESGGTIMSSGLNALVNHLHTDREVIVIQISDGDNLSSDNGRCVKLLTDEILPKVKYFKYIETNQYNRHSTILSVSGYKKIENFDNFSKLIIKAKDDALKGLRLAEEINSI